MRLRFPRSADKFKIASTNGVSDHLKALEKKGYIRRVGKRAIEVLSAVGKPVLTAVRDIPIVGRVPAGKPFLSEENIEGLLTITNDMGSGKLFALQVRGDSMIGAGILDGDRVIVKQQGTVENGEIVCALIEGEATLKRFLKKTASSPSKRRTKNMLRSPSLPENSASWARW